MATVEVSQAEAIVRALADTAAPVRLDEWDAWVCTLCEEDSPVYGEATDVDHEPGCPWRMAREWVARVDAVDHEGRRIHG